jgi:hypothetical protein
LRRLNIEIQPIVLQVRGMSHRKASSRIKIVAALIVVGFGALAGPSFAESPNERKWRKACQADAFSLCPLQALSGNRAGVRDCLLRKIDRVSDPCAAVIKAAQQQAQLQTQQQVQQQAMTTDALPAH